MKLSKLLFQKRPAAGSFYLKIKPRSLPVVRFDHQCNTPSSNKQTTMVDQEQTRKKWRKALQVAILPGGIDLYDQPQPFFH